MQEAGLNNNISLPQTGQAENYATEVSGKEEGEASSQFYPELILDPSGQWYWDCNQQQWFPYYQSQPENNSTGFGAEEATGVQQYAQYVDDNPVGSTEYGEPTENRHVVSENCQPADQNCDPRSENAPVSENHAASTVVGNQYPTNNYEAESVDDLSNGLYNMGIEQRKVARDSVPQDGISLYNDVPGQQIGGPVNQEEVHQHTSEPLAHQLSGDIAQQPVGEAPRHDLQVAPPPAGSAEPAGMGPPDLVDHRHNTSQPEIVSDIGSLVQSGPTHTVPPPDMFAALPGSTMSVPAPPGKVPDLGVAHPPPPAAEQFSEGVVHSASDIGKAGPPTLMPPPDLGAAALETTTAAQGCPDLGSLPMAAGPRLDIRPDLTAQSVINSVSAHSGNTESPPISQAVAHDQHYDFYKGQFESAMPDITSGRSGVLPSARAAPPQEVQGKAPDILRTEPLVPTSDRNLFMETGELREEDAVRVSYQTSMREEDSRTSYPPAGQSSASMPPAAGKPPSGLPPMVGGNDPPSLVRMVVGLESLTTSSLNPVQRLVEGESTDPPNVPPPLPVREVEGEAIQDPLIMLNTRTIEGEDDPPSALPQQPPPVGTREVEGQMMSSGVARLVTGVEHVLEHQAGDFISSSPTTPEDSSPARINSQQPEARSEAAGSDRRDQTVMGGPPPLKAPPLPTPGRDVAGQESTIPFGSRRRGDHHKKPTYDSDEDRNPDSESEREREQRYLQSRRTGSPGARSTRSRPSRAYDRMNRSSTDRDDDSDRRNRDYRRDRRGDDDRYHRKDYSRGEKGRYRDSRRYRDDEDDDIFRDDERHSVHGGSRRVKEEPYHRYREEQYYRRHRNESDYERESHYGEDLFNR